MNQRDDFRGGELERGRESSGGQYERDNYPHSQRHRPVTNEWEAARGYGGGVDDLAYGSGQGRYRGEAPQPNYGSRDWRDRSSGQDPYGFAQRTQRHDPYQHRPDLQRTRYREDPYAGHFPRDQYGREHSSEQLFEREPFGRREDTHYYGTGSVGWGGPGYTGGAYAYGDASRYENRPLEGEYSDESALSYEGRSSRRPVRRYPPGPKGYKRSDERLQEDISERLLEAYHIDSSEVTVAVQGAKVTLEGTVPSRHMKHAIEDMVDACPGVLEIDNRVRVAGPNYQGSSPATMGETTKDVTKDKEADTRLPRH